MKKILFLSMILLSNVASAESASASSKQQSFDNWTFEAIKFSTHNRFRVASPSLVAPDKVFLTVDRVGSDCDHIYFTLNVANEEWTQDQKFEATEKFAGKMRVDSGEIHNFSYIISSEVGSKVRFISIVGWENSADVDNELRTGKDVRFQFKLGNLDAYEKFSLAGYAAAEEVSRNNCLVIKHFDNGEDIKDYFKEPQNKNVQPTKPDDINI